MRNYKNNIILHVRNITLYLENITSFPRILKHHLTDKAKIITLCLVIIMLSFANIINVSALSYSNSIGIGFTFNPSLSISLSSSDLVINDLVPGSTLDSNDISISISTNSAYGYILSANINNEDLVHSNNINTFSSIATNADLSSLNDSEDNNIWGYSASLDNGSTWSNYNGLSSSTSTTLLNTNTNNTANGIDTIDFKIAAKASNTQASGTYTGTINFVAVTNVAPMSLLDSFIASGAEQLNGYFKMQDMTHSICQNVDIEESELQLIDVRDNKIYWVAKLKDGNCWMTQNLELDLVANSTMLNSTNTDIDPNSYNPTTGAYSPEGGYSKDENTNIVTWSPVRSTVTSLSNNNFPNTTEANSVPYSYNPGDRYYYPNYDNSVNSGNDFSYTLAQCEAQGYTDCKHYKASNYYNWSATIASNDTSTINKRDANAENSICPKGWGLPMVSPSNDFLTLINAYNITEVNAIHLRSSPLYFVRSGYTNDNSTIGLGNSGRYWSSTVRDYLGVFALLFRNGHFTVNHLGNRYNGFPVRCIIK